MKATVFFDPSGDMAAIQFNNGYVPREFPVLPLNHCLEVMYSRNREEDANLSWYTYECWDGDDLKGVLLADGMELEEPEMYALFERCIASAQAAQNTGRLETKEFDD